MYSDGKITVVIPAKNEAASLDKLLPELNCLELVKRVIVVNDGSTDHTSEVLAKHGVDEVRHVYSKGNGAAIKSGARLVDSEFVVFMDGDGQHAPAHIEALFNKLLQGYDMVVGARKERASQASAGRHVANSFYNRLASLMVSQKVEDLTSGFRIARTSLFKQFLALLPNGFSYPTTITMSFFRAGYSVGYLPIEVAKREGDSHIRPIRDGIRFVLIIFKIATLYSPLKLFLPLSLLFMLLGGGYTAYTLFFLERFTNMSALLLITSLLIFLIGLISEQITTLVFLNSKDNGV